MGDLTATGKFIFGSDSGVNGNIAADTLALPPFPADLSPLWSALNGAKGKINLTANRVLFAGAQVFGLSAASMALQPDQAAFTLTNAAVSGGALTGNLTATFSPSAPPALTGNASLTGANAAGLIVPLAFPLTLPSGTITAQAALTASGYTPQAWAATLSGDATMTAANGAITGFDLAALAAALSQTPREAALRNACLAGSTPFSTLTLTGNFTNGIYSITNASLQGLPGTASATGSIDLPDQAAALNLSFSPNVPAPPRLGLAMIGPWSAPHKIPAIKEGLDWQPEN
jgi:AsmA protein